MIIYNPDRIILMRRLEKRTQSDLAGMTGISMAKISKIQNRIVSFSQEDAAKIAKGVDYPLSFFEMESKATPPTELTYRRSSKTLIREINAVSAEYEIMSSTVNRIAEKLQIKSRLGWIEENAPIDQGPLPIERINSLAQLSRVNLGIPTKGPVTNVTRALERAGIAVLPMRSSGEASRYKTTSEGVTNPTLNVPIPVIGYLGRNNTGDRLRFTKAHELGHLVLHRNKRGLSRQQMEREAHQFAGAFLMPKADAEAVFSNSSSFRTFIDVKAGWGMSISALVMRVFALELIDTQRVKSLQVQIAERGWRKHEPVPVTVESPLLFKQMMGKTYGTLPSPTQAIINSFAASNELGIPFRYLDLWADGLQEEGAQLGFYERRLDTPAPMTFNNQIISSDNEETNFTHSRDQNSHL